MRSFNSIIASANHYIFIMHISEQTMTSSYNYSQYNPAFDNQANDRNSQMFWDAVSMTSSDRNSIALSIYHSVPELQYEENSAANRQSKNDKVKDFFFIDFETFHKKLKYFRFLSLCQ